jgi:xanthine dehydrogenase accessory factor
MNEFLSSTALCEQLPETNVSVLDTAYRWFESGTDVLLITVTRTWGSAPRPVGSMAAISRDGRIVGSVSGGCIEDDLAAEYLSGVIEAEKPTLKEYGIDTDEARRFGLPCGGRIGLVLEPVSEQSCLGELLQLLSEVSLVNRTLHLASGRATAKATTHDGGLVLHGNYFETSIGRTHRLLLIGAGDLSLLIATNALGLGFQVTICDPREEYQAAWPLPGVTLSREMPDDVVIEMQLDARCAVIALTHDPKLDDLALMEALRTDAFYVAAIGSRKSQAARLERLRLFDVTDEQLCKLSGPAGIYIGALTPHEIAVSILAELIARRRGIKVSEQQSVASGKNEADIQAAKHSDVERRSPVYVKQFYRSHYETTSHPHADDVDA